MCWEVTCPQSPLCPCPYVQPATHHPPITHLLLHTSVRPSVHPATHGSSTHHPPIAHYPSARPPVRPSAQEAAGQRSSTDGAFGSESGNSEASGQTPGARLTARPADSPLRAGAAGQAGPGRAARGDRPAGRYHLPAKLSAPPRSCHDKKLTPSVRPEGRLCSCPLPTAHPGRAAARPRRQHRAEPHLPCLPGTQPRHGSSHAPWAPPRPEPPGPSCSPVQPPTCP